MSVGYQVRAKNPNAAFTLKIHRGDGMALLAMNWKQGPPPDDFVGFAIEHRPPDSPNFFALKNRLAFPGEGGGVNPNRLSTLLSPIQMFRWIHFPFNAELDGLFTYRVTPVFMNAAGELAYGERQEASLPLRRDTYPGKLNVTFTRGFVSSQAFVDRYQSAGPINTLIPAQADDGLDFVPTHPKAAAALEWMGFEAVDALLELLDQAIADAKAEVRVVAYDLNEPEFVERLEKLGARLRIIIDDSGSHGDDGSAENKAAERLTVSAGAANVKRQHMGGLQHNKMIVVKGPKVKAAIGGSTNFSWRGFYIQSNNALVVRGAKAIAPFWRAFDDYWNQTGFATTPSAEWSDLGLSGIDARVTFSPHAAANARLDAIADDLATQTTSSLFYSLAFLYQTPGRLRDAIVALTTGDDVFVYGISDKRVGGFELLKPDGNRAPVFPATLAKDLPEPFKSEPAGGSGNRLHHKFLVIDFDKPTARVYLGSYNFSASADTKNGENLLLIRNRRVATSYMVEALRIFDHYHFRVNQQQAETARTQLTLTLPPSRSGGADPWWKRSYTEPQRIRDRELFS